MFIITGIPVGKLVKGLCIAIFGQTLPEDALLSRIALMSILGFFFLPPLFFRFHYFLQSVPKCFLPGRKPSLTVSRNRASDYFYPGSEYFILKTQFPCYRHFFLRSLSTLSRSSCVWLFLIPYYIIGNTSYFFSLSLLYLPLFYLTV